KATLFVTLFASFSVTAGCAARAKWVLAQGQHPKSFQRTVTVDAQGRLLLYLPAGFDRSGATRYPLLIFLHGSGESGEDLEKLKVYGPPRIVAAREDFPFIVASPQARNSIERFDPVVLGAMLEASKACGGDARLTVYPDTGHDSWTAAYADPELFTWLLQQRRKAAAARK